MEPPSVKHANRRTHPHWIEALASAVAAGLFVGLLTVAIMWLNEEQPDAASQSAKVKPGPELRPAPMKYAWTGRASFYHSSLTGERTASGERYNPEAFTAAHRELPFGTRVRVTNLRNDKSVVVRINDRGPYHDNRILDLSRRAAQELGMLDRGVAKVRIEVLSFPGE